MALGAAEATGLSFSIYSELVLSGQEAPGSPQGGARAGPVAALHLAALTGSHFSMASVT